MVAPRNPLNIGAAARAMSNFGCLHLRLVNPYHVAFREARSAVHAGAVLQAAREYESLSEAVSDCELIVGTTAIGHRELKHTIRSLEPGGRLIKKQLAAGPTALLFGSEKFGLSNEDLSYCHWLISIPTHQQHRSMNLGQSVAVCLYELIRKSAALKADSHKLAGAGELDRLTALLIEALDESGYLHSDSTTEKVRRLVRRMNLSAHDAGIWFGMVRQILWKLRKEEG